MSSRTINSPFEKCLDCIFNEKETFYLFGFIPICRGKRFQCSYNLMPVARQLTEGKGKKKVTKMIYICYGYSDVPERHGNAKAWTEIHKRANRNLKRFEVKQGDKK